MFYKKTKKGYRLRNLAALLMALAVLFALAACSEGKTPENNTPESNTVRPEDVAAMSYEDYMAAAPGAAVVIEGYVQKFAYNQMYGTVSMFIADGNGGFYYAYRATCSQDQASKMADGVHVKVSGKKAVWSGEIEIDEGSTFEILEGNKVLPATDISGKLSDTAALEKMMNQKISIKGLTVVSSTAANGDCVPFLYNWDGSGASGANNDLYFNLSLNGVTYNFCVESDENAEGTGTYKDVTDLHIGDIIDLEGMLYWYNGPNVHVNSIAVIKASVAESQKSEGVLNYGQYLMAAEEEAVTVEAYVQGKTVYDEETNCFSMYLADDAGAYYAFISNADKDEYENLDIGTKVKVTGAKAVVNGMPEIAGECVFEIQNGYYISAALNATDMLENEEALEGETAKRVIVRNLRVVPSRTPNDEADHDFIYNWDGSGAEGANCDVFFTVETENGKQYTVCVESDENPEDSEVYKAATELHAGDEITIECFLFWNEGPQLHVQKISVRN